MCGCDLPEGLGPRLGPPLLRNGNGLLLVAILLVTHRDDVLLISLWDFCCSFFLFTALYLHHWEAKLCFIGICPIRLLRVQNKAQEITATQSSKYETNIYPKQ